MHSRVGQRGSLRLTISRPSAEMVVALRYCLTSLTFAVFLEGRVPWVRWACVRRRSGHSNCNESQAALLVNGGLTRPERISSVEVRRTTDASVCFTKLQIWQVMSVQSGGLRLAKPDGRMTAPATC